MSSVKAIHYVMYDIKEIHLHYKLCHFFLWHLIYVTGSPFDHCKDNL